MRRCLLFILNKYADRLSGRLARERSAALRSGGFSLLELMVSVGIMSVTLLLVLAVFTTSMRGSQKSTDLTAGVVVAESVLTKEVYDIVNSKPGDGAKADAKTALMDGNGKVVASGIKNLNHTTFVWELKSTKVIPDGSVSGAGTTNNLLKLDATVWWGKTASIIPGDANEFVAGKGADSTSDNKRNEAVAGKGVLRCELSRLYNSSSEF